MKWSWQVARVAGIGIYIHITFLLLPIWIGIAHFSVRRSWGDALAGVGFILILFGIVVLHELGHAVTARRFGIGTRDITLLPIGGLARLERMPENPKQELLVALAGPAVNVCLAILVFAILGAGNQFSELTQIGMVGSDLLTSLFWVNVALAVFNMIPAFPMDGGRVLRSLLAMRFSYVRATNVAARIGQGIAFLFAFLGLSSLFFGGFGPLANPFLIFIGLFVWVGAAQEAGLVQVKSALGGVPVRQLMIKDFRTVTPQEPLARAVSHLLAGWQHDFPVLQEGYLVGLLTRTALVNGLAEHGPDALVGESMARDFPVIDPDETAENALIRLRTADSQTMLAVRDGVLFGVLTNQNVGEYLLIRSALHGDPFAGRLGMRLAESEAA
ncbi:MAG TPA: site-2 protease family protein [Clostridia bacterium]|nr:site-2 protease family protein [Clostridia bacterium]